MLTTGILSLNIHDSLTFEGTELCLNPDLFSVHHGIPKSNTRTVPSAGANTSSDDNHRGFGSASINSCNSGNTSQHSTNTPLEIGDMVEIRVWDPLPKEATAAAATAAKSPSSTSIMRKALARQCSQQPPLPPVIPTASSSTAIGSIDAMGSSNISIPSLHPRTEDFSPNVDSDKKETREDVPTVASSGMQGEAARMADSVEKVSNRPEIGAIPSLIVPTPTPPPQSGIDSSVAAATTNNAVSSASQLQLQLQHQQSLPPVFPKVRTGTVDNHQSSVTPPASKPLRPNMIHRRVVSSSGPSPIRSPKQQQQHPHLLSSQHVRDISDMTVDTHQLDISGALINQTDSQDWLVGCNDLTETANEASLTKITSTHRLRLSFVLKATEKTFSSIKGNSRTQISMLRQVADLYNLSTYDLVTVHKIESQDEEEVLKTVSADFVVVTIKDQFISRGDMLLFQAQLNGSWIYEGERLTESTRGIKAHAREIRHGNFSAKSGIVTEKTMITFRSRSARIVWLVQLSEEMVRESMSTFFRIQEISLLTIVAFAIVGIKQSLRTSIRVRSHL
jgi:hypothetical protein